MSRYRRSFVFLVFAVACFAMVFVLDSKLDWVPKAVSAAYVVLALASAADTAGRRN